MTSCVTNACEDLGLPNDPSDRMDTSPALEECIGESMVWFGPASWNVDRGLACLRDLVWGRLRIPLSGLP